MTLTESDRAEIERIAAGHDGWFDIKATLCYEAGLAAGRAAAAGLAAGLAAGRAAAIEECARVCDARWQSKADVPCTCDACNEDRWLAAAIRALGDAKAGKP